jgi:hypothetical protein
MKHFKFFGLIVLFLSACSSKSTQPPVVTFTLSPVTHSIAATPIPSATEPIPATQPVSTLQSPPAECKDSVSVTSWTRDDIPYDFNDTANNKPIPPNGHFTMAWTIQNSGTCVWDSTYRMAFNSGHIFSQSMSYPIVPPGQIVAPGRTAIVVIGMVSPSKAGGYQARWQLQNSKGKSLMTFNVIIKVDRGSFNPPSRPSGAKYSYTCKSGTAKITLSWVDAAINEDGYRIYRGGMPLFNLSANTASYTDVVPGPGSYEYTVVAFNAAGEAPVNISAVVNTCQK